MLHIPVGLVEEGFGLGNLRVIRDMKVDAMLALVTVAHVAEMDRAALPNQKRFLEAYAQ